MQNIFRFEEKEGLNNEIESVSLIKDSIKKNSEKLKDFYNRERIVIESKEIKFEIQVTDQFIINSYVPSNYYRIKKNNKYNTIDNITNFKIERRELFIIHIITFSILTEYQSISSIHNEYNDKKYNIVTKIDDTEILLNDQEKINIDLLIMKDVC